MTVPSKEIQKTVASFLKVLSPRNKDIISRRFGLKNGIKETLESIGKGYGITRERVRQIEEASVNQLSKHAKESQMVAPYVALANNLIESNHGVLKERDLFHSFSGQDGETVANASLVFLLALSEGLVRLPENDTYHSFWAGNKESLEAFKNTTSSLISTLKKVDQTVHENDFSMLAQKSEVPSFAHPGRPIAEEEINAILSISKEIDKNIFNEVGLAAWPEVKPKGVKDKAYLVLKKEKNPKHFTDIAKLINAMGFSGRKANTQTVHNELIKDVRFILVGRGMYALSEWGYKSGTVKEVLVDILQNTSKPVPKAALMAKVLDTRMVKENTVLLNLQDAKTFIRHEDGSYSLKK